MMWLSVDFSHRQILRAAQKLPCHGTKHTQSRFKILPIVKLPQSTNSSKKRIPCHRRAYYRTQQAFDETVGLMTNA
jgi:hypothetical protein